MHTVANTEEWKQYVKCLEDTRIPNKVTKNKLYCFSAIDPHYFKLLRI